jgi:anti-sigma factor RsiW
MLCKEIENKILDYQENRLSPVQREDVKNHLAVCATCQAFAQQLQLLDAALLAKVKAPVLPANFNCQVWERTQAEPMVLSESQRVLRKRELQAEFEAGKAKIRQGSFGLGSLWSHLARPAMAAVAGWFAWIFASQLIVHLNAQGLSGLAISEMLWLAASTVFLVVSLTEAFPRLLKLTENW